MRVFPDLIGTLLRTGRGWKFLQRYTLAQSQLLQFPIFCPIDST
ncbi:hypothetical protein Z947_615 [Sulfitobacter geojensis]|nr:hypothetical protein Z947_615 [Sulfitobacter geojensis]